MSHDSWGKKHERIRLLWSACLNIVLKFYLYEVETLFMILFSGGWTNLRTKHRRIFLGIDVKREKTGEKGKKSREKGRKKRGLGCIYM